MKNVFITFSNHVSYIFQACTNEFPGDAREEKSAVENSPVPSILCVYKRKNRLYVFSIA